MTAEAMLQYKGIRRWSKVALYAESLCSDHEHMEVSWLVRTGRGPTGFGGIAS